MIFYNKLLILTCNKNICKLPVGLVSSDCYNKSRGSEILAWSV